MPNPQWTHRTIAQLSIMATCLGQSVVNVHHFEAATTLESTLTSDAAAQTVAANLITTWVAGQQDEWLSCHGADYVLTMLRAQVLERPLTWRHRLTPTETPASGAGSGITGGVSEDNTTCAVIRWRTPQAGKSFRSRSYVGPVGINWQANGLLTPAGVTAYTAYKDAMITAYGAGGTPPSGWVLTVYSRPYNRLEYGYTTGKNPNRTFYYPPEYAGNSTNITVGSIDPVLRTQRRRQIGRGA